jgi:phospholipid/cholesterol/gamma-HCH transport system substrate-binding protein
MSSSSQSTKVLFFLIAIGIVAILGFNFLGKKGLPFWKSRNPRIVLTFSDVSDLSVGASVKMSGLVIGEVEDLAPVDESFNGVKVTVKLDRKFNIPDNSTAYIQSNFAGLIGNSIVVQKGSGSSFLKNGGMLQTVAEPVDCTSNNVIKGGKLDLSKVVRLAASAIDSLQKDSTAR